MARDFNCGERMATVLVRHKVGDYGKWKSVYDEGKTLVKSSGGKRQRLFKNSQNDRELVILTEFDDLEKAHKFAHSDELKQTMSKAGVAEEPTVYFLEELEDQTL